MNIEHNPPNPSPDVAEQQAHHLPFSVPPASVLAPHDWKRLQSTITWGVAWGILLSGILLFVIVLALNIACGGLFLSMIR